MGDEILDYIYNTMVMSSPCFGVRLHIIIFEYRDVNICFASKPCYVNAYVSAHHNFVGDQIQG